MNGEHTGTDLVYRDAVELAHLIRTRAISCREVMEAFLKRQKELNPAINAIVESLDDEQAVELAVEADRALARKEKIGPLHGLPIAAKEYLQVRGWRSSHCWAAGVQVPALEFMGFNGKAEVDGLLANRMRKAGLLFIGKTNMPEFAFGSHTINDLYGPTRNPYHLGKTAGGSSGGAAAALASGMLPLADGSDLGGSLRNPAAFCNVVGFRPSIGRVPMDEAGWAARMATAGPMGRSVRDVALLLSVQAGPHQADPLSIPESPTGFAASLETEVKGWRLGWTADFGVLPLEQEVENRFKASLSVFKDLGLQVEPAYPEIMNPDRSKEEIDAMSVFRILRVVNIAGNIRRFHKELGEEGIRKYTNPITQYQMIDAFKQVDAASIFLANENRLRIYGQFLAFFEKYDFLVCPATQVMPFDIETDYVRSINQRKMQDYLEWMSICCLLSITGLPVISIPCGFGADGLPVGLQIAGRPGADWMVLQLAHAFEEAGKFSAKFLPNRPF